MPLIVREEHRLQMLRRICGPNREEVTGHCRNSIMRIFDLYSSPVL
jgi:hypothetical protein